MHFNAAMSPNEPDWDYIFQSKIPELLGYLRSKITADNTSKCSSIAMLQLLCVYFKEVNSIVQIYKVIFYAISRVGKILFKGLIFYQFFDSFGGF